jgi:hypothetical protein
MCDAAAAAVPRLARLMSGDPKCEEALRKAVATWWRDAVFAPEVRGCGWCGDAGMRGCGAAGLRG